VNSETTGFTLNKDINFPALLLVGQEGTKFHTALENLSEQEIADSYFYLCRRGGTTLSEPLLIKNGDAFITLESFLLVGFTNDGSRYVLKRGSQNNEEKLLSFLRNVLIKEKVSNKIFNSALERTKKEFDLIFNSFH